MPSDAPATPRPLRGGVAVGRGGVCIIIRKIVILQTPPLTPPLEGRGTAAALRYYEECLERSEKYKLNNSFVSIKNKYLSVEKRGFFKLRLVLKMPMKTGEKYFTALHENFLENLGITP